MKPKILCIFAHREDHIVAGWPILQNDEFEKHVFICTNDHPDVVKKSISLCADSIYRHTLPNGFVYKTDVKTEQYEELEEVLSALYKKINPDFIFTHNPWGEYGHFDHRTLFSLVYKLFRGKKILVSNIVSRSTYYPVITSIPLEYRHLYKEKFAEVEMDIDFYNKQADIFSAKEAWTKNRYLNPPIYQNKAGIYVCGGKVKVVKKEEMKPVVTSFEKDWNSPEDAIWDKEE